MGTFTAIPKEPELTDNQGLARVFIDTSHAGQPGKIRVEASGFKLYVQNIDINPVSLPKDVQLELVSVSATEYSKSVPTTSSSSSGTNPVANEPITTTVPATSIAVPELINGSLEVNQPIKTDPQQLNTTLKSIEILPTGMMRWHFEFWNKGPQTVSVRTLPQSYVVDDLGNRYALVAGFDLAVQAGVRAEDKADFEAPKSGATAFTLHLLNGYIGSGFEDPALTVSATLKTSK